MSIYINADKLLWTLFEGRRPDDMLTVDDVTGMILEAQAIQLTALCDEDWNDEPSLNPIEHEPLDTDDGVVYSLWKKLDWIMKNNAKEEESE